VEKGGSFEERFRRFTLGAPRLFICALLACGRGAAMMDGKLVKVTFEHPGDLGDLIDTRVGSSELV
jgi:hypothetical protein